MKKVLTALLAGTALLLSACTTQTAYTKGSDVPSKLAYQKNQSFFVFGIGQERTVNAVEVCGNEENIAKVESRWTAPNIIVGLVTFGIYVPRESRVYCQN